MVLPVWYRIYLSRNETLFYFDVYRPDKASEKAELNMADTTFVFIK